MDASGAPHPVLKSRLLTIYVGGDDGSDVLRCAPVEHHPSLAATWVHLGLTLPKYPAPPPPAIHFIVRSAQLFTGSSR